MISAAAITERILRMGIESMQVQPDRLWDVATSQLNREEAARRERSEARWEAKSRKIVRWSHSGFPEIALC